MTPRSGDLVSFTNCTVPDTAVGIVLNVYVSPTTRQSRGEVDALVLVTMEDGGFVRLRRRLENIINLT